ncbi:MAG TPA: ComEA family DNA-binding protein [bacterium]|nr:ComEA family DNA-binding protein [bacterium]
MLVLLTKYRTLIGIGLVAAILIGCGILYVRQTAKDPITVSQPDAAEQSGSTDQTASSEATAAIVTVMVDVEGAVQQPGVYELPSGSRIEDAITAAGGLTAEADLERFGLSRAARVTDEQLITVPRQGEVLGVADESTATVTSSSVGCISINTASQDALESLTGIGAARAAKIISNRPYSSPEELVSKKAIPQSTFDGIRADICL